MNRQIDNYKANSGVADFANSIAKIFVKTGVASRRAGKFNPTSRVRVNGKVVKVRHKVNPATDIIKVNGKIYNVRQESIYILLNKPKGILTTVKDPFGRPTVLDLIGGVRKRIFPVGRLDKETEGLLLLTNDGEITYRLTHPKFMIFKTYIVHAKGTINDASIRALEKGITLTDGITAPTKVNIISISGYSTIIELKIYEGRKRQIRRMCDAIGHPVINLKRIKSAAFP